MLTMRVESDPSPASRPRVGKFGTYYAKSYQIWTTECQKQFAKQKLSEVLEGPLAAVMEIVVARPKTTKRAWPRGDSDNYAKGPLDAATKAAVWVDDDHVIIPIPIKRYAAKGEKPGCTIHIGKLQQDT